MVSNMVKTDNEICGVWRPTHPGLISSSATNQLCKGKQDALLLGDQISLLLNCHSLTNK